MTIKLIALDMDGTTLNSAGRISPGNRAALERAAGEGVRIMVATGRPRSALPEDALAIGAIRYALTSNGARVTDLQSGDTVYENCMSPIAAERSVELLKNYNYVIECFIDGVAYIQKWYYDEVERSRSSFRSVDYILSTRNPVEDIYGFILSHRDSIENININFDDISEKPAMREKLLTIPEATITSSFNHNLEIGGATTSKADALEHMCGIFGITRDEMMAVGDSPNDIAMLKAAGIAVAVGNAKDEVKAVADYVAPSNNDDGVADAIERFVLKA